MKLSNFVVDCLFVDLEIVSWNELMLQCIWHNLTKYSIYNLDIWVFDCRSSTLKLYKSCHSSIHFEMENIDKLYLFAMDVTHMNRGAYIVEYWLSTWYTLWTFINDTIIPLFVSNYYYERAIIIYARKQSFYSYEGSGRWAIHRPEKV